MIPSGYKQTEIGVIPEDWELKTIKEITIGKLTYGINAPAVPYAPPLPNYIRITDISDNGYFIKANRASVESNNIHQYILEKGDILFARTGASTGKTYLYRIEDGVLVYAGFLIKASINHEISDSKYVFYALHTQRYWDWVAITSMRSGQPGINGNEYSSFQIPYPQLTEQQKIAEVLSDVDGLIASLEKLIEKKKALKQGVMQELLTGKRRLPGFSGEWIETSFESIYSFAKEGGTPSTSNELYYKNGNIPFVKIEDLSAKYISTCTTFITNEGVDNSSAWIVPTNSVILSNGATIGEVSINRIPVATKQGILGIIPSTGVDFEFLYYLFSMASFRDDVKRITTHGTMDCAYLKDLNTIRLFIPSDKNEQIAISSILSEIDNELERKKRVLEKYRQLKSGMMSKLLTGRIRLM